MHLFSLLLLISYIYLASADLMPLEKCTQITDDYQSCMDHQSKYDLVGASKCIPVLDTPSCQYWNIVEKKSISIDYSQNQQAINQTVRNQINQLILNAAWAGYAYDATANDTNLTNFFLYQNQSSKAQAYVGYDPDQKRIIAGFRGTEPSILRNWFEDFDVLQTPYIRQGCNDCEVAQGFYWTYKSLGPVFDNFKVLAAKYPKAPVVVVGHSLGASISIFFAVDAALNGQRVYLYTYGGPRTGNPNFAHYVNNVVSGAVLRAVYRDDPIPNSMPYSLGYLHIGTEVHFYDYNHYLLYPAFQEDYPLASPTKVNDHHGYWYLDTSFNNQNPYIAATAFLQ